MKTFKLILVGSFLILAATIDPAPAQYGGVVFVPPITPGDCVKWLHINVLADSGGACGGTGSPGGSNTQVQFNSSSSFGGITGVTSNGTLMTFAAGDLVLTGAVSGDIGTFTAGHALQDSGTLLSSLAPLASPTFSGTTTAAALTISGITGSTQCLHASTAGVVSGTGSDCGSGGGTGNALFGTTTGNTTNDIVTMSNTTVGVKDSGTLLSSLAPLASPAFTGSWSGTGLLTLTGADGSQIQLNPGGGDAEFKISDGASGLYVHDVTNNVNPLILSPNAGGSLTIGTTTNAFTGPITGTTSLSLGTQQTTQGSIVLDNTAGGAYATTLKSSNSASAAYTFTFPTTAGTNGYFLSTDGSGNTSWAAAGGSGTVTSIATGAGLTGGTITTSGTISATYVINAQTGTTYTVLSTDASKLVTFSNSSPIAVTVPQATGSFAAGFSFDAENLGAGLVTLTPTTSTVNGAATLTIPTNYGCTLVSDGTNWQVSQCTAVIPKATSSAFGLSEPDNVTIKATAGVYADQYPTSGDIMVSAGNGAVPTGIVPGTGVTTALADNTNGAGGFCVIGANACAYKSATIGWIATVNPNNAGVLVFPAAATLVSLVGNVETATGSAATVSVNVASSGTACSAGTTVHSGSFNANGTAATNQTLTLTTTAITSGQRLCLQTTGTTSWTGGTGVGTLTVTYTIP